MRSAVVGADRASNFLRAVRAWHEARAASRHLHALTDQQLKDIGMNRSEIERLVHRGGVPRIRRGHADD
jgi:uncharacterized protein YjiS (DUF1127 family)